MVQARYRDGIAPLLGQRRGRLVVAGLVKSGGRIALHAICDCGAHVSVRIGNYKNGRSQSCGCLQRALASSRSKTHGLTQTATYRSWRAMRERCYSKSNKRYAQYGARGIEVCPRWRDSFENFFADMGARPAGATLDRINNAGDYSPENCRWASSAQQANNTRRNRVIKIGGVAGTLTEWARHFGVPPRIASWRANNGWDEIEAVSTPVMK